MNNSDIHVMNKYYKTFASAVVTFALVISAFATPVSTAVAVTQLDSQFGFDTTLNLPTLPDNTNNGGIQTTTTGDTSGEVVSSSNSSFTNCALEASKNLVTIGEGITLNWTTTGFDTITINGQSVSGNSGSKVIGSILENTTFTLEALNNNGSKCVQRVQVTCIPEPKECGLLVEKTVNKSTALPNDRLTYTITVKNIGDADCTGGGVKIEDVVDANLTYESHQLTSNLSAGYGSDPVYTAINRTLHFNGNVLTPGESGTITWVGKVNAPAQCGNFEVNNQAKATALELNNFQTWSYSPIVKTIINNGCVTDRFATVVAHKIVCTDEAQLPNYGNGGPDITANTAANWVATHNTCSLEDGWEFEWTNDQSNDPGDTMVGKAGAPWTAFGPTDVNGKASVKISLNNLTNNSVWFREVLKAGYIPFTHGLNGGTNVNNVSAEFYCNTDVINYDNRDVINGLDVDKTYYCVAWNSPVPNVPAPTCDMFTATPGTITVGNSSKLVWETSNANQVFLNNGIGAVALDGSIDVSPLADIIYKLTVIGADNKTVSCEVPVKVSVNEVPVCERFTATPNSLPYGGGSVALNWSVAKANTASIAPTVGVVSLIGSKSVNVTESTTFVLTAIDDNGDQVTCPAPVTVADPQSDPFTCANNVSFSVSDSSITRGENVVLTWNTTDVDSVSISTINATALAGSQSVSPSSDITYTLSATKGSETINCPVSISVTSGGGGGGSSSPRCDLDISDTKIKLGEEITLKWDTSNATEVTLTDDRGKELFSTSDYLAKDKVDYYDGSIKLKPSRDTKYTLLAERGSRDEECEVKVEIEDNVVLLQTRDQQPLVAGISLSQVPYTGFEAGPFMTFMFYVLLVAWAMYISYLLVVRQKVTSLGTKMTDLPTVSHENIDAMKKAEVSRPDAFVASVVTVPAPSDIAPMNLPTGTPVIGYENHVEETTKANPHQVNDVIVTKLENHAHAQKALLSSDAVRHFVGTTTNEAERNKALDEVISEAKKNYPLEDGWVVINESRMKNLCTVCKVNNVSSAKAPFIPATVPKGTGSLAEAIVTGNIIAAYEMIGNRPMFALADAAADLDAVYRQRRGGAAQVSEMLLAETKDLSDQKIKNMIDALTGAIDGTYTDEASAVKMSIMKAVKELA